MKKGILAAVFTAAAAFILLFALLPLTVFSEGSTDTYLYGTLITDAEAGKEYTVNIGYADMDIPSVKGITLNMSWDTDDLELVSVNSALAGEGYFFVPTELSMSNSEGFSKCPFMSTGNLLFSESGSLLTMVFRVKDGARGSLPIDIDVESFGADSAHNYADAIRVSDACITLKGETPSVTTAAGTPEISTPAITTASGSPEIIPNIPTQTPNAPYAPSAPSVPSSAPAASTASSPTEKDDPIRDRLAKRFPILREYEGDEFSDLNKSAWYFTDQYIQLVYSLGLMEGRGGSQFAPDANLKLAEAITLAVRLRDLYDGGTGYMSVTGMKWYEPYVDYAVHAGIIREGRFPDVDKEATRAEMAEIFASALPKECYEAINSLTSLPDVPRTASHFGAVLALYNAGILQGDNASRTFRPNDSIRRSEVAAIIIRMVIADRRIEF
ncbi:MAG: S-layer homology domain-containing protein [Ruminococcaceae bacterium]|nr:S-layer homology domain-containing protein [Oscillospiraceae bacterium]